MKALLLLGVSVLVLVRSSSGFEWWNVSEVEAVTDGFVGGNPLFVGLTLIRGADAKGAGICASLSIYYWIYAQHLSFLFWLFVFVPKLLEWCYDC